MTEPKWLTLARGQLGLKEIPGPKHEAKVLQFYKDAGHPEISNDETAWCAAFANAMLKRAGVKGTGSLLARSFLEWGEAVLKAKLQPGDIVVLPRAGSTWQGHVAFFLRMVGDMVEVIGGNQNNAVTVARYAAKTVLGYRRPKSAAKPAAKVAEPEIEAEVAPKAKAPVAAPTRKKDVAVISGIGTSASLGVIGDAVPEITNVVTSQQDEMSSGSWVRIAIAVFVLALTVGFVIWRVRAST